MSKRNRRNHTPAFKAKVALGLAIISPNLAAMISKLGGRSGARQALGTQNAANSCGQAIGPLVGSALLLWNRRAPFVVSGALFVAAAALIGWRARSEQRLLGREVQAQKVTS